MSCKYLSSIYYISNKWAITPLLANDDFKLRISHFLETICWEHFFYFVEKHVWICVWLSFLMTFSGMILEGAFSLVDWITAPSMFCLSKRSTLTTSKWRMNAALVTMRPESSSCRIWPVTSWTKCLVSYVTHSCAFMIDTHWSTEHFSSRLDNITGLAFK